MFSRIIGPNIELRPLELRYADEMYQVADANRDHLRPFMPWIDKTNGPDDIKKFINDSLEGALKGKDLIAGIWENNRYVGNAGLHADARRPMGEIGYWLAADAQGRGIMTRTCAALIDHAFGAMNLHRIEIRCDPVNARSRAIPKRLGFTEEATLRQALERWDGAMVDSVVYGLLKHEWKQ